MKKKITHFRWLVTTLMLVAAMVMPSTAWAQESTVTFTAQEGTAGFSDSESYGKLIDGKYAEDDFTKWCLSFPSDGAYIIFSASESILVSGYSIVTGNDNASNSGRNPKSWALYGCNDASAGRSSENWVLIDQKNDDTVLQDENYQKYDFTSLSNPPSVRFQYFKMEITATKGADVLQMSELILTYTSCNHNWEKTDDVINPTCTDGGYDVYKCSLCQLTKNVANDNGALGHQWVNGDVVPPTCTTDGYTTQTCSRCHAEQIINIVNATGHQWGNDDVCDVCQINNTVLNRPQGDGTLANPYKISTVGELYWFAGLVNGDASVCDYNETDKPTGTKQNTAACAVLITDITVNSNLLANLNEDGTVIEGYSVVNWKPIGNFENKFTGTFDGKGHAFSGLYFNDTNTDYVGLFGLNRGTIKNVGVVDSYFKGNDYVGGVCGFNSIDINSVILSVTITNSYNTGSVSGNKYVGGVCGYNLVHTYAVAATATITSCYNTGSVSGSENVGGLCGYNKGYTYGGTVIATTTDCYNTGSVSGNKYVGGVCGYNEAGTNYGEASAIFSNCHNTGSVSGNESVGGVCGYNKAYTVAETATATATITNCYFYSTTYSGDAVGGNSDGTISNVMSKSTVQFKNGEVCYLLNNGKTDGSQAWYQTLSGSGEGYPNLNKSDEGNRTVYAAYTHGESTPASYNNTVLSNFHTHAYDSSATDEANGNHDMSYEQEAQNPYTWTDNEDYSNATAQCNFICSVCNSEVAKNMTVTHDEGKTNVPAKCEEVGYNYYKASLTFNGTEYSSTYTQEVPILRHDDTGDIHINSGKSIYEKVCKRDGCDVVLGYYATSDGSVEAIEDPEGVFTANDLTLQDATAYDNQAVFTATNFTYTRTFSNTNWTTWYVPFELTLTSDICAQYDFSRINNVHQYDTDNDGTADKTVVESFRQMPGVTLKANYPYLVKPVSEGDVNMVLNLEGVKPALAETNSIDCQSVDFSYTFKGTYTAKGEGGSGYYDPYTLWTDGTWRHFQSLDPMRHYLTVTQRNSSYASVVSLRSIMLSVIGDEGTTGIVNMYSDERKAAETYDLGGRRLPAGASQRGVVIENGKLIIKK